MYTKYGTNTGGIGACWRLVLFWGRGGGGGVEGGVEGIVGAAEMGGGRGEMERWRMEEMGCMHQYSYKHRYRP